MKCPGQDSRYWKPGAIFEAECPVCGKKVEFFKDDTTRRCGNCGHRFLNPEMDFGCAAYCQHADQCIGNLPPELIARRQDLLKDRVAIEAKRRMGRDFKRIGNVLKMARHAEKIAKMEKGDLSVILPVSYLHELAILKGTDVAAEILRGLNAPDQLINRVVEIISRLPDASDEDDLSIRIAHDAGLIARLERRAGEDPMSTRELDEILETSFLTTSGQDLAKRILTQKNDR